MAPLCLLALDGGGIRGLSELIIIEELMERIKWRENLQEAPLPADRFDLIGGTSTGGLIAILLGRLRLSAADAIKAYEGLAGAIFSQKKTRGKDGTFKASKFEEAIRSVVASNLGNGQMDARMFEKRDESSTKGRAFVCAVTAPDVTHPKGPTLFRTYDVAKNREYNCAIWEAARATSAAPTIFKRIKIGAPGSGVEYLDAGLGCNNPIEQVIEEAQLVFGQDAEVACILSIGTGKVGAARFERPEGFQRLLPTDLIKILKEMATETEKTAERMTKKYKNASAYHRLDVDRGLDSVSLDEWKRLGDVRAHTKNYMKLESVSRHVDEIVGALSGASASPTQRLGQLGVHVPTTDCTFYSNRPNRIVHHFITRRSLLNNVNTQLFGPTKSNRVVLQGMGGSGKTQLALECCRHAEVELGFIATFWVDSSSPASLLQSFRGIALLISRTLSDATSNEAAVAIVHGTLQNWKQRWLMVFDNYDDPAAFQDKLITEYIPQGAKGAILFTSRHGDAERLGNLIKLSSMTEEESIDLLLQRPVKSHEENAEAAQVVSMLGFLPLALDQAAAYIRSRGLSLERFISEYRARQQVVLQHVPDEWEYRRKIADTETEQALSVFTTWELSLDMISGTEEKKKAKTRFLSLAAFFDNKLISERYFLTYSDSSQAGWMNIFRTNDNWDSYKLGDVLAEFGKLSLLQVPDQQASELQFSIHPLVCEWMKLRMAHQQRLEAVMESISALTSYLMSCGTFLYLPLLAKQETVAHIDACLGSLGRRCSDDLNILLKSQYLFAESYYYSYRYEEAQRLCEQALAESKKALGPIHLETLDISELLGNIYREQGNQRESERLLKQVLAAKENGLGSTHLDTMRTAKRLACLYLGQLRHDEAETLLKQALTVFTKSKGPDHPSTMSVALEMAGCFCKQRRYEEANRLCEPLLEATEYGYIQGDAMRILGCCYSSECNWGEAQTLFRRAIPLFETAYGTEAPHTLFAKMDLAYCYYEQGRCEEAERIFKEALPGLERIYGAEDPNVR